jgi:regulator of nucleoside diphosphate kinase
MQKVKHQLVFREDDYEMLTALNAYFKKGKLLSREEFPGDVVRLNSKVKLKEAGNNKTMELVLVMPEEADIKQKKISVMTPAGIALIGFREGQEVMWEAPSGKKKFTILEVDNQ